MSWLSCEVGSQVILVIVMMSHAAVLEQTFIPASSTSASPADSVAEGDKQKPKFWTFSHCGSVIIHCTAVGQHLTLG